ncbi:MAG: hypothetical protein ACLQJR_28435 [Stellaceae bacterium]
MACHRLEIATSGQGLHEITEPVARWAAAQGMAAGLLMGDPSF